MCRITVHLVLLQLAMEDVKRPQALASPAKKQVVFFVCVCDNVAIFTHALQYIIFTRHYPIELHIGAQTFDQTSNWLSTVSSL